MKTYRADLHVHTVLSPCAEVEMIPPLIVQTALQAGLNLIAITDHNHTANISAVMQAAEGSGLTVLPGMELQTHEEVHMLCLFDTLEQAYALQALVDQSLPNTPNNIEYFGEQFIVDSTGDFVRREERLLLNSTLLTLEQAAEAVRALGGLPIPAHVNRRSNGLLPLLGFIPPGFEVLEISRHLTPEQALEKFPSVRGYPLLQSGDVHTLDGFLGTTQLTIENPAISEIRLAISDKLGRKLRIGNM